MIASDEQHAPPATAERCWCDGRALVPAPHPDYQTCTRCGTAVLRDQSGSHQSQVIDEQSHLYGDSYWDQHQTRNGLPTLQHRARTDLVGRAQYWLHYLLKYRLPSGRALEIGCAHGGLVKFLGMAGFDAMGLEMSPRIIRQAQEWFGVSVRQGPLGSAHQLGGRFDLIVMFDVVEHLNDPKSVLSEVTEHLTDDGVLAIQTPRHRPGLPALWRMYLPPEHTYLFTAQALSALLAGIGLSHVVEEPPVFPDDMFLFASRQPLKTHSEEEVAAHLSRSPDGRMLLVMQDLYRELGAANRRNVLSEFGARPLGGAFVRALWAAVVRRLGFRK